MNDEDKETSISPSNGQHHTRDKTCECCGAAIDTSDWYPVTKERNSDESLQFFSFCSEECQEAWLEERAD